MNLESLLKQYDFALPKELIAQKPSRPRDSARLLIYRRKDEKIYFDVFANIAKYLPKNSVLVFNETKVVPAKLTVIKPTGGKAEILYISHDAKYIKALSNKPLSPGTVTCINDGRHLCKYNFFVQKRQTQFYFLKPNFPISQIKSILKKYGQTPLPPYIKNSPLSEKQKREQYQTVFAKQGLSVAAPTASLHFTKKLITKLKKQGIGVKFVQLDVNLGTFAPLNEQNLKTGKLHSENYSIDAKTARELSQMKKQNRPIIAVGTTVVRTLESASKTGSLAKLSGSTELFIKPGFKFQFISGLITNFHVRKSSLLMLVSAVTGRQKILQIYGQATKKRFRFFSFGDGMLIL